MVKVMLVEDEPEIRLILKKLINKQDGFEVVTEAGTFAEAVQEFTKYKPDVVFVDIDLNGESGLECAKVMVEINPKVKIIFATAHSEYMANAFEIYAFDYLVKPFNMERVIKTLSRIKDSLQTNVREQSVEGDRDKLLIKGRDQIYFINKKEIILVERADSATNIVTKDETFRTSASLGDIEGKLSGNDFMRCHKSYIINTSMISKIEAYGRWTYVVKFKGTDATALITSQKYEELKERFS